MSTERQIIPMRFKYKKIEVPESLFNLCLKYIAKNLDIICTQDNVQGHRLHEGLVLPSVICEAFMEIFQNNGIIFDNVARLFEDVTKTNLKSIRIHQSNISDHGLEYLLRHNLYEISISMCNNLTQKTYMNIFKYAINLRSLTIGPHVPIVPLMKVSKTSETLNIVRIKSPIRYSENAPNLKHLIIQDIAESYNSVNVFLNDILDKFLLLNLLDLSYCTNVGNLKNLSKLTNLHTLILFNVPHLQENYAFVNICLLQSLVFLDISQTTSSDQGVYKDENETLALIVKSLPKLMYLDISGTNLAGKGTDEHTKYTSLSCKKSDIPGLECRVNNPLEFLGLYHTMHNACQRDDIPAKIISGDANENQILNAAASSMVKVRPEILQFALKDLKCLLNDDKCTQINQALDIVLEALTRYVKEKKIQMYGRLSLISILQNEDGKLLLNDITVKCRIITILLTLMDDNQNYDELMMFLGSLALYKLRTPEDMMFEFNRFVRVLLHIVSTSSHGAFSQKIGIHLILFVVLRGNYEQIYKLGNAGIFKKIMLIIKDRLHRRQCDDIFEMAWSIILNVADKVPTNFKRFLSEHVIKYCLECLKTFSDKHKLVLIIMDLMERISEVKKHRPKLMQTSFIEMCSKLLFSSQNGFKISHKAAGVIAHLASDGKEAWVIKSPSRSKVLNKMSEAIQKWDMNTDGKIKYNTFKPILQLAQVMHTPECQYWAVWTVAYFTKLNPETYCKIMVAEEGLKIMSNLINMYAVNNQNFLCNVIRFLARIIMCQCVCHDKKKRIEVLSMENQ